MERGLEDRRGGAHLPLFHSSFGHLPRCCPLLHPPPTSVTVQALVGGDVEPLDLHRRCERCGKIKVAAIAVDGEKKVVVVAAVVKNRELQHRSGGAG